MFATLATSGIVTFSWQWVRGKLVFLKVFRPRQVFHVYWWDFFNSEVLSSSSHSYQNFLFKCLTWPRNELQSSKFGLFRVILTIFKLLVLAHAFNLCFGSFLEKLDQRMQFHLKLIIFTLHWLFSQYLTKCTLCSALYKLSISALLVRKTWNFNSVQNQVWLHLPGKMVKTPDLVSILQPVL